MLFRIQNYLFHQKQAKHSNIMQVFGAARWKNAVAIIMEFMPRGNLADLLAEQTVSVTPIMSWQMCLDIASGLAHIHGMFSPSKIVHGDVKPENLLLTENLRCKIADFGGGELQLKTENKIRAQKHTKDSDLTILYSAPELLENISGPLMPAHDVFSFGIVSYEILEHRKPIFMVEQLQLYLLHVVQGLRPNIDVTKSKQKLEARGRQDESKIFDLLVSIVQNCWRQDPASRPSMITIQSRLKEFTEKINIPRLNADIAAAKKSNMIAVFDNDDHEQKLISISKLNPPFFDDDSGIEIGMNFWLPNR